METTTETNEMTLFIDILSDMICQYLDAQPSVPVESVPSKAQVKPSDELPKVA